MKWLCGLAIFLGLWVVDSKFPERRFVTCRIVGHYYTCDDVSPCNLYVWAQPEDGPKKLVAVEREDFSKPEGRFVQVMYEFGRITGHRYQ